MTKKIVPELVAKYIRGTVKEAIVQNVQVLLCNLTATVAKEINCENCFRVYISTRALKHGYDKRSAEEYDFLIENLHRLVKYPQFIYRNKKAKRGNYIFVKDFKDKKYFCSIELIETEQSNHFEVVTFFRLQKESYLFNYDLLWEWEGRQPSS